MSPLDDVLTTIEALVVAGDLASARSALRSLRPSRLPRPLRSRFASLARRAQLPLLALRCLARVVRPTPGCALQGTPSERVEYGFALAKLGLTGESIEVLETVDGDRNPQALLGVCAARFSGWDYEGALPVLRRYLASEGVGRYERLVAEVNLAAALVATERTGEAAPLLARLLPASSAQGLGNLKSMVLLLSAQLQLVRGDTGGAANELGRARGHLEAMEGRFSMLLRKWEAILRLRNDGPTAAALDEARAAQRRAAEQSEWETFRHLEAHLGLATGDRTVLARVYFGTPYPPFRRWLEAHARGAVEGAESFSVDLGPAPAGADSVDGTNAGREAVTLDSLVGSPSSLEYRTLRALCTDLFRPLRLVELFPIIYEGVPFDPDTGIERLKFAVKALRKKLAASGAALELEATGNGYRLTSTRPLRLSISVARGAENGEAPLAALRRTFSDVAFSCGDAARVLGMSERSARRLLSDAASGGAVTRAGRAKATRYRIAG